MSERFKELWTAYLEGDLGDGEMAELEAILSADPELRKRAADLYEEHRHLGLIVRPPSSGLFVHETLGRLRDDGEKFVSSVVGRLGKPGKPRAAWPPAFIFGLAAGLLLAFTFVFILMRAPSGVRVVPVEYVATVVRAGEGASLSEGERLPTGALTLERGSVMVRFDGGAVAILSGPAEATLESRHAAILTSGRATVRCVPEAAGFTVRTPTSEVVDLGTEFAVVVKEGGATEVHVLDGTVEWRVPENPDASQRLGAGEALRIEGDEAPRSIPAAAPRFGDLAREMTREGGPGDLLAYEGFEYSAGTKPVEAASGGFGWAAPWRLRRGEEIAGADPSTDLRIRADSLTGPWRLAPSRGGSLELPRGSTYRIRELSTPIDLGRDGVTFLSYLTKESPRGPEMFRKGPHSTFRMTFRSRAAYWKTSFSLQMSPVLHAQVDLRGGGVVRSAEPYPAGEPVLWVVKIVARRDGMDQVFFKAYRAGESLDAYEPLSWTAVSPIFKSDARLDLLVVTGTGRGRHWLDEIRFGKSWAAVTPRP